MKGLGLYIKSHKPSFLNPCRLGFENPSKQPTLYVKLAPGCTLVVYYIPLRYPYGNSPMTPEPRRSPSPSCPASPVTAHRSPRSARSPSPVAAATAPRAPSRRPGFGQRRIRVFYKVCWSNYFGYIRVQYIREHIRVQ